MTRLVQLLLLSASGSSAWAHEIETHRNMTAQAMAYLEQTNSSRYRCAAKINAQLELGAADEDAFFPDLNSFPLGRFYFHFFGNNATPLSGAFQSASCISQQWGFDALSCTAHNALPLPGLTTQPLTKINALDWNAAVRDARDPVTGLRSDRGWDDLGYVIHLLEDLTSPAHTRNDPHPCPGGLFLCDVFERANRGRVPALPSPGSRLANLPDPATLGDPKDFFATLQAFVRANFFSFGTTFDSTQPGPGTVIDEDALYFYGPCLAGNDPACFGGRRKLARKNSNPKLASNRFAAWIDETIAKEQFAELGPIIVEYVAAFIEKYVQVASPQLCPHTLTVASQGEGHGDVTVSSPSAFVCANSNCAISIPDGARITLTAIPDASSSFTSFSNTFAGINPVTFGVVQDLAITVTYGIRPSASVTTIACSQANYIETVQASGLLQGPTGFSVQVTVRADPINPNIFTFGGLHTNSFGCGAWSPNPATNTCTRVAGQPAQTAWSQTSALQWFPRFPNAPPAGGVSLVLLQGGSQNILASQHADCAVQ